MSLVIKNQDSNYLDKETSQICLNKRGSYTHIRNPCKIQQKQEKRIKMNWKTSFVSIEEKCTENLIK